MATFCRRCQQIYTLEINLVLSMKFIIHWLEGFVMERNLAFFTVFEIGASRCCLVGEFVSLSTYLAAGLQKIKSEIFKLL